ncbi:heterokaryon incompatibility protein-domain-containing protein [Xylaria telfairii]|nr:heterokaryon incompatibility protein-domain-containing protein [Xylaria telfairii]
MPIGDGSLWQVSGEDLEVLGAKAQALNLMTGRDLSLHQPLPRHPNKSIYAYSPLPKGYIRVAELYPGHLNDDIVIKLHHEPFQSHKAPAYEALSYFWGSKTLMGGVRIVEAIDSELQVTRNLDVALRHLRYTDRPRFLWVDAICIDQQNNVEKGPQVAMMCEIYRLASRVVVWLGPEENHSDRAMSCLEHMGSQVDYGLTLSPLPGADKSMSDIAVPIPLEAADLSHLYHLICRPWFERLWVRQEIMLASKGAVVLCGSSVVPWSLFRRGCACVYLKPIKSFKYNKQFALRLRLLRSLILYRPNGFPLNEMRLDFGDLKCEDPRDRIYALLGLLHKDVVLNIQPDYTKSAAQVYEDIYTQYINNTNDLNFLAGCRLSDPLRGPSWLPRWSLDTSTAAEGHGLSGLSSFASTHFRAPLPTPIDGKLKLMGVSVGRIQRLRENRAGESYTNNDLITHIRDAFFFPPRLLSADYISGGTLLEAFTHTLFLGQFSNKYSPPVNYIPEHSTCEDLLRKLLENIDTASFLGPRNYDIALTAARGTLLDRYVYETEEGFVGVAPREAKSGDEIYVVIGCNVHLVLRHVDGDKHILVGGCYVCGIDCGEALLGPLPRPIRMIYGWDDVNKTYRQKFVDDETGAQSLADPRVKDWPIDYDEYTKQLKHRIMPLSINTELLRENGVDIRSFTLI